jgi:MFS family permease
MFYVFLLLQALSSTALHGTRPLISLYADSIGASVVTIGLLVSSFALVPMFMAVKIGKYLDEYGARTMTIVGLIGTLAGLVLPAAMPVLPILFVSQILIGFFHLSILVSLQKTVGNLPGDRDKLIAAFSLVSSLGEFIGPLSYGFIYDHFGFRISYTVSAMLVIVMLAICAASGSRRWTNGAAAPAQHSEQKGSAWLMLKQVNLLKALIVSGLVLNSKDLFVAYFPVYGSSIGMSASSIGTILAVSAVLSMAVRLLQFRLVQSFGRGNVLFASLLVSGLAFIFIPLNTMPVLLAFLAACLGGGLGLGQPLSLVYALNVSPQDRQGEVLGMRLTFNRGSQFIAPFLFGGIGGLAGLAPIFWVSGAIILTGAFFTRMSDNEARTAGNINRPVGGNK